jgi:hypothetical protein
VAVLFKLIELVLRHDDRPHEEATFAPLSMPGNRLADLFCTGLPFRALPELCALILQYETNLPLAGLVKIGPPLPVRRVVRPIRCALSSEAFSALGTPPK